jgi:uncharacterized repeat protein (TIGR01451 family)
MLASGTFKPTNYGTGDTFSPPAPSVIYGSTLSAFSGTNPNGNWSLYVQDDSSVDTGSFAQGWQIAVTTLSPVCCNGQGPLADIVMSQSVSPPLVNVGSNATFTLNLTNLGLATASNVVVTDALPAGLTFVSAVSSQGSCTNDAGVVSCDLGTMTNGAVASVAIQVVAASPGTKTNLANVSASIPDPNPTNNTALVVLTVNGFPFISDIPNVVTNEDSVVGPLAFTIGDAETPPGGLGLSVVSSDTNLVPIANIFLGGASTNRTISVTPANNLSGSATITVAVTDGMATASDSFLLTVNPVNDSPVLAAITNFTLLEGAMLTFTNFASDVETPTPLLVYSLASGPTNAAVNPTNGVFTWVTTEANGPSTNTIAITVMDNGSPSMSTTQSFVVVVLETNAAPVLGTISNETAIEGTTLSITNTASDPDLPANVLTFSLENAPAGAEINPTNGVFTWTPGEAQGPDTNLITVVVHDNGFPGLSATQTFTVIVLETNQAPVLTPVSDVSVVEGGTVVITNVATDTDLPMNQLVFSLASAPTNAVINPTNGIFSWMTSETDGPSTNRVSVVVTDSGAPSLSATQSFTVIVLETNSAPTLAAITNFTIVEGEILTFTNVAADPDIPANALTFSLEGAPTNAVINSTNGVFSWTPTEAQGPSSSHISVVVTDNGSPSMSATQSFNVIVLETNAAPVLAVIADRTIHAGYTLFITNSATDSDIPTNMLTFSLDVGAPPAANITSDSGILSWTPSDADVNTSHSVTVRVTDNGIPPLANAKTFLVTVVSRPLISSVGVSNNITTVKWTSLAGQIYRLQYLINLSTTDWVDVLPDVNATGSTASQVDVFDPAADRYYRVKLIP